MPSIEVETPPIDTIMMDTIPMDTIPIIDTMEVDTIPVDTMTPPIESTFPSYWIQDNGPRGKIEYTNSRKTYIKTYSNLRTFENDWWYSGVNLTYLPGSNLVSQLTYGEDGSGFYPDKKYFYKNGVLDSIYTERSGGFYSATTKFEYDFSKRCPLVSIENVESSQDFSQYNRTYIFEYTGANCDIKVKVLRDGIIEWTYIYEFDLKPAFLYKKGPLSVYDLTIYTLPIFSKNNIVSLTLLDKDENVVENSSYESVYEYNSINYPVTETRTYANGRVSKFEFFYE